MSTTYKGCVLPDTAPPSGEAGRALYDNFKSLADRSISYRDVTFVLAGVQTTGTNKTNEVIVAFAGAIVKAKAYAKTAPTGANLTFDINKNGTTIYTTQGNRLKIVASANSGVQIQQAGDVLTVAENDRLTIDVDTIGTTIPGSDVTVVLTLAYTNL